MLVWAKASGSVQGDLHLQIFALQNFCFPTLAAVLCFFFISYIFFVFYQTTVEDVFLLPSQAMLTFTLSQVERCVQDRLGKRKSCLCHWWHQRESQSDASQWVQREQNLLATEQHKKKHYNKRRGRAWTFIATWQPLFALCSPALWPLNPTLGRCLCAGWTFLRLSEGLSL